MAELHVDEALRLGISAHKSGQIKDAGKYYTAILQVQPNHPDANHNMGVLAASDSKLKEALPFFKTAVEANPRIAQFWVSYIDILIKLNKLTDAKSVLDQAKSKGAKGDVFGKLEIQINDALSIDVRSERTECFEKILGLKELGSFDDAIELALESLSKFAEDPNLLATVAHCYLYKDNLEEARRYLNKAKKIDASNPLVYWNSARIYLKTKEPERALSISNEMLSVVPHDVEGMAVVGACLRACNRPEDGLKILNKALKINPNNAEALTHRGIIFISKGDNQSALNDLEKAFELKPFIHQIWIPVIKCRIMARNYLGAIDLLFTVLEYKQDDKDLIKLLIICVSELDDNEITIKAFKTLSDLNPNEISYLNSLANAYQIHGQINAAIDSYQKVVKLNPSNAKAHFNLGFLYFDRGERERSLRSYKKAIRANPEYAEAHNNLGNCYRDLEKLELSMDCYKRAISINPKYLEAFSNGAEALEKFNKLAELEKWLLDSEKVFDQLPPDLIFHKARLFYRRREYFETQKLLGSIELGSVSKIYQSTFMNLKGQCADKLGNFEEAFEFFSSMNSIVMEDRAFQAFEDEKYIDTLKLELLDFKKKSSKKKFKTDKKPSKVPSFLIGFPRSGTTLLDTILRSHSKINVVEEQPTTINARKFLNDHGNYNFIDSFPSTELRNGALKIYFSEFERHISKWENKKEQVDKLPLNLLQLPMINFLFPNAKYIMALRHPCDVVLSCWMQNFELNSAMANMVDLRRIVDFYCLSMELFMAARNKFSLDVHFIRYEDLIIDMRPESTKLLNFLNLDWEDSLEKYNETALSRNKINTPSYSQVVQPLYKDSTFRWKNYRDKLSFSFTLLEPWILEFGYDTKE